MERMITRSHLDVVVLAELAKTDGTLVIVKLHDLLADPTLIISMHNRSPSIAIKFLGSNFGPYGIDNTISFLA